MLADIEIRITKYVHDHLSPTATERNLISLRYKSLTDLLKGPAFQSGSYSRYTSITPVNDLDIIWQLPPSYLTSIFKMLQAIDPNDLEITRLLEDLATRLQRECADAGIEVRIRAQSHSVGVYFGATDEEFSMDIVPGVPTEQVNEFGACFFMVPDIALVKKSLRKAKYANHDHIGWIKSDPRGYKTAADILNERTPSYRKATKVIKAWKRAAKSRNSDFPLKSFHLEMIINTITSADVSLGTVATLLQAFEELPDYIKVPRFPDRADKTCYIDEYIRNLTPDIRMLICSEIAQARTIVTHMANETDADKAEQALRRLIGHPPMTIVQPVWVAPATSRPYYETQ